jgi:hypothetical protein
MYRLENGFMVGRSGGGTGGSGGSVDPLKFLEGSGGSRVGEVFIKKLKDTKHSAYYVYFFGPLRKV